MTKERPTYLDGVFNQGEWKKFSTWLTASRQAPEWGNRTLRANWRRLLVPLPVNAAKRRRTIEIILHIHNFHAHNMGFGSNQVLTVHEENRLAIEALLRGDVVL